jgi:F-type H+-transporting ATPase subunit b
MKKKKLFGIVMLALPVLLLASGHGEGGHYEAITGRSTDFIPRIFNFLIFAGLLYYLIAEPVKNFFKGRQTRIADQLKEIEQRLQEAKEARKNAEQELAESEKKAEEIVRDAGKEVELLTERYRELGIRELEALERQYKERIEMEERKMQRETIVELLDENIGSEDIPLGGRRVIDILSKKVA